MSFFYDFVTSQKRNMSEHGRFWRLKTAGAGKNHSSSHSSFPSSRANFFEAIVLPCICLNSSVKGQSWYYVFIITLLKLHLY